MVGKIFHSYFRYFDKNTKDIKIKSRPILILAEPNGFDTEFTVLPVSTISNQAFYTPEFDISIKIKDFPLLSLSKDSYIRAHKQTVIYKADINFNRCIGDLKKEYSNTFYEALTKTETYQKEIIRFAKFE